MGIEPPDTSLLGALVFILVLALAKRAPTLAGSGPGLKWLLTHREPMWLWWEDHELIVCHWFGSAAGAISCVWTGHRSRMGNMSFISK